MIQNPGTTTTDQTGVPICAAHGSALVAADVTLSYDRPVVSGATLSIPSGAITVLVGPNGSGKSTLLKGLARLLKPDRGSIDLHGTDLATMRTVDIARQLGVLPQSPTPPDGLTVSELVQHGRHPHRRTFSRLSTEDTDAVRSALDTCGISDLADRALLTLSGGQRQRAWIAMTLAQQTPILLVDEPTTHLDPAFQLDVLETLARLNRHHGHTIAMVLHDLNQTMRYADHVHVINEGRVVASGHPYDVLTPDCLRTVFRVDADIVTEPRTGRPHIIIYPLSGQ